MDLPTYTNIWRIEKKLYKLYDFRLPAPLPITWIAVFAGITVPYIFFLVVIGLPFNHNLVWLYVLPPGVLTWLTTRPVIESKKLPELVSSQLRYLTEPQTWCRMAPLAEKDDIFLTVRAWHRHPSKARPEKARKTAGRARSAGRALELSDAEAARSVPSAAPSSAVPATPALAAAPVLAPVPPPAPPLLAPAPPADPQASQPAVAMPSQPPPQLPPVRPAAPPRPLRRRPLRPRCPSEPRSSVKRSESDRP